jgi:hypothetical protein
MKNYLNVKEKLDKKTKILKVIEKNSKEIN